MHHCVSINKINAVCNVRIKDFKMTSFVETDMRKPCSYVSYGNIL